MESGVSVRTGTLVGDGTEVADGIAESVAATIVAILLVSLLSVGAGALLVQAVSRPNKNVMVIRIDDLFILSLCWLWDNQDATVYFCEITTSAYHVFERIV
jgi:hypothetical protein